MGWAEDRTRLIVVIDGLEKRLAWTEAERDAERARADRAEQGREGERSRSDALRDRIDAAQAQIAPAEEAARQAHAGRKQRRTTAARLQEAVAAGRARGRLRRVLAALRRQGSSSTSPPVSARWSSAI